MDLQEGDTIQAQRIVIRIERTTSQLTQQTPDHGSYTVYPFPGCFKDIDDRIKSPLLASFGPRHRGIDRLRRYEEHKLDFLSKFVSRTASQGKHEDFYVEELGKLNEKTKRCYSDTIALPSDDELVNMMLLDGSFMVELFLQYEERRAETWPPDIQNNIQTLIADMLKLENQLPFFILDKLFDCSNFGQRASTSTLPTLALRFLNQAFCSPSDVVNSQIQHPKHLLDLFRLSLLPSTETYQQQSNQHRFFQSIQSVKNLRRAGFGFNQKTAKSFLEIDFRRFHLPPLALKIPPVAIDDFTSTILVNCAAFEQCFEVENQYFSAYICFMNCLMRQPEDVEFLRSIEIISRVLQDETSFIKMLNSVGSNVYYSTVRDCYLWKQCREIHSYYNSFWASIWRHLFDYSTIMLLCSILNIPISILIWRLSGK
ncbi:hypothetical protein PTKIN_Ptkin14bG0076300 [Pterospermum kingtungense]